MVAAIITLIIRSTFPMFFFILFFLKIFSKQIYYVIHLKLLIFIMYSSDKYSVDTQKSGQQCCKLSTLSDPGRKRMQCNRRPQPIWKDRIVVGNPFRAGLLTCSFEFQIPSIQLAIFNRSCSFCLSSLE